MSQRSLYLASVFCLLSVFSHKSTKMRCRAERGGGHSVLKYFQPSSSVFSLSEFQLLIYILALFSSLETYQDFSLNFTICNSLSDSKYNNPASPQYNISIYRVIASMEEFSVLVFHTRFRFQISILAVLNLIYSHTYSHTQMNLNTFSKYLYLRLEVFQLHYYYLDQNIKPSERTLFLEILFSCCTYSCVFNTRTHLILTVVEP